MTLWAHVHRGYASYEGTPHEWGQGEYDSFKLVQTLKGKPINRYATLKKPSGEWVTITTQTPEGAFDLWGEWAAIEADKIAPHGAYLVPIPSAECIAFGTDQKGSALVAAIVKRVPRFTGIDAIHWSVAFPKASQGGPRDVPTLYENIRLRTDIPKREIILIDDVITGGGHAVACARALRWAGHKVEHIIAVARTIYAPPVGGIHNIPVWDIEADHFDGITW